MDFLELVFSHLEKLNLVKSLLLITNTNDMVKRPRDVFVALKIAVELLAGSKWS